MNQLVNPHSSTYKNLINMRLNYSCHLTRDPLPDFLVVLDTARIIQNNILGQNNGPSQDTTILETNLNFQVQLVLENLHPYMYACIHKEQREAWCLGGIWKGKSGKCDLTSWVTFENLLTSLGLNSFHYLTGELVWKTGSWDSHSVSLKLK